MGVAVVINDRYSGHRYLRLPWLAAGASETFSVPLALPPGAHRIEVIADPEGQILEELEPTGWQRLASRRPSPVMQHVGSP